ncbi:MAG: 23S rRNA (pseudouridine(1915)-N(3))-methyltransferase RlmH [Bacteroidales bacterium]
MKIALLLNGKTSEDYIAKGISSFAERIKKYTPFEIITLPDIKNTRNMPVREKKIKEAEKILGFFREGDYVVILDEKGKEYSTLELSKWLEQKIMLPMKRLVFVIGGPWGFADEIYDRADASISLSRLTFSHQIIRLLFLEQLYRVFTVIKGEPYHHV